MVRVTWLGTVPTESIPSALDGMPVLCFTVSRREARDAAPSLGTELVLYGYGSALDGTERPVERLTEARCTTV